MKKELHDKVMAIQSDANIPLSSVGGNKRKAIKERKEIINTIVEHLENLEALTKYRKHLQVLGVTWEQNSDLLGVLTEVINALRNDIEHKDANGQVIKVGDTITYEGAQYKIEKGKEGMFFITEKDGVIYLWEDIIEPKDIVIVQPKVEETEKAEPKKPGAKPTRKIGDIHPKHPDWVWTEYKPGKFDWRTKK